MNKNNKFPSWLMNIEKSAGEKLKHDSRDFFKKSMECYPYFYEAFLNCPSKVEFDVINDYSPSNLEKSFTNKATLFPSVIANISQSFHFEFVYQMRELAIGQRDALEKGAFYVGVVLSRSLFETVCANYYTFRRLEEKLKQSLDLSIEAAKTKSEVEQQKLILKIYEVFYEMFSSVFTARIATSLDWNEHLKNFGADGHNYEKTKPIHINKAIEDIEKVSGLPLVRTYGLLSEFVHPNFGAKTLILHTRQPHQQYIDKVTLGDNSYNQEAALWYLDQMSESLYYTFTLACSLHQRSENLLDKIFNLTGDNNHHTIH